MPLQSSKSEPVFYHNYFFYPASVQSDSTLILIDKF
jgi:hypothetical protein